MTTLRVAVIGVGYLGRFHAQKYAMLSEADLVAVVDTDLSRAQQVASEVGATACDDYRQILDQVDAVSIVVPTQFHFAVARDCLNAGCHILLEKPVTRTVEEADELIAIAAAKKLVFQAGHLERFNPAVLALKGVLNNPVFIESHRLAPFKPRGTDVDVVLDLMIHDIDILLSMVASSVKTINSIGAPVLSQQVDIANARLQFENGCVANVTASRVSRKTMRQIRIFQPDAYISIDYQTRNISILHKGGNGFPIPDLPETAIEERSFGKVDALLEEIRAFLEAVQNGTPPLVSGEQGKRALELALQINRKL